MQVQGYVGPQGNGAASLASWQNLRLGNMGDAIVSELHANGYEATYRNTQFSASMQAVIATALQTGLTTAMTGGLVLANPYGNTKNLVVNKVGIAMIVAQTSASALGLAVGQSATALAGTLTSVTPTSDNVGSGVAPTGVAYSSATVTLPIAPVLKRIIGYVGTGAITVQQFTPSAINIDGGIILPPGAFCNFYATNGLIASSYMLSLTWEEVPI